VVFDVETTGTNILEDEIIEIAGLKVGIDGVVDTFHKYIKNSKPVGESFKIHNISDSELATVGEEPEKVFKEFIGFIKNCLLVGHNVHFDISIFKSELKRLGFESIEVGHYYDTLEITRRFFPLRRYNLEYICKELNIFKKPIHRAREDTEATNELLKILIRYIQNKKQLREKFVEEYYKQFEFLSKQLEKWKIDMEKNRPPILLQNILEESGLIEYWERQEDGLKRIMNFRELISLFRRYDDEIFLPSEALINILNITSLSQDVDRYLQHDDRVLLLTVHQAKGLEFDTVFIAGATDNEFPSFRSQEEGRLDEEHRLFYVAMSRAKKRLFITYHQMNKSGRLQERSRFIDMIPEEVKYINCKSSNT
jgi:DNA helicase-2/ATP-dependent DNA helicase PcrA